MKLLSLLIGLMFGFSLGVYVCYRVVAIPEAFIAQCQDALVGIQEAERIISKISADYENDMNRERRNNILCAVKGRLPPGKTTSTIWRPNIMWDGERWLKKVESGAYLF